MLIEETDIEDLDEALSATENPSVSRVLTNLRRGSSNHLAAFTRALGTIATFEKRSGGELWTGLAGAVGSVSFYRIAWHGFHTGDDAQYGYWQPVVDFLDAAQGKVIFVQSKELADLATP